MYTWLGYLEDVRKFKCSRGNVDGYRLDGPWFKYWQTQESFCSPKRQSPLWVPTHSPTKWISEIKRPEREDDHLVSSSAKVKNERSNTSSSSIWNNITFYA